MVGSVGSALLQLIVIIVPALRELFGLTVLTTTQWLIILGMCVVMLMIIEVQKWAARSLE